MVSRSEGAKSPSLSPGAPLPRKCQRASRVLRRGARTTPAPRRARRCCRAGRRKCRSRCARGHPRPADRLPAAERPGLGPRGQATRPEPCRRRRANDMQNPQAGAIERYYVHAARHASHLVICLPSMHLLAICVAAAWGHAHKQPGSSASIL